MGRRHDLVTAGRGGWWVAALALPPLAVLGLFFVLPVSGMLGRGLWPDGHLDLSGFGEVLGTSRTAKVVWFTLWSSAAGTAIATIAGLPLAYVAYRLRFRGRGALRVLLSTPFVLPTIVVAMAFKTVFDPRALLGFLGWDQTPWEIVAALAFFNVSVVVRTVGARWESLDPRPAESAAALGASPFRVLRTVTLPALRPSIISASSVVFLFCATSFGVVLALGGLRYSTVETEIYLQTVQLLDLRTAAVLSLLQIALVSGLLAAAHLARGRSEPDSGVRSTARRVGVSDLPVVLAATLVAAALSLPLLALVMSSLRVRGAWTLDGYRALTRGDPSLMTALGNSLAIAVDATAMALGLGVLVSLVVTRRPTTLRSRRLLSGLEGLFMLPLGVSAVTVGFGFLITLDHPPIDLRSSGLLVPVAQALVALPIVVRVLTPSLHAVDDRQRQAAAALGAGPVRVVWSIDLPLMWRPLLAAVGFAFAVSMGEFGATSFLVRPDTPTVPVLIYQQLGHPGALNLVSALAASVMLGLITAATMVMVEWARVDVRGTTW